MSATNRLSLLQYEHLSLGGAAAAQFTIALKDLEVLDLPTRYENSAALYLGDIAEASDREQLASAKGQGIGFAQGLLAAKAISEKKSEELCSVYRSAAERAKAGLPA
ncbi:hypothetical protein D3C76_384050 [compost metagenome]